MTKKRKEPLSPMIEVEMETIGFAFPGMYHWPGFHVCHLLLDQNEKAKHPMEYTVVHLN